MEIPRTLYPQCTEAQDGATSCAKGPVPNLNVTEKTQRRAGLSRVLRICLVQCSTSLHFTGASRNCPGSRGRIAIRRWDEATVIHPNSEGTDHAYVRPRPFGRNFRCWLRHAGSSRTCPG